MSLVPVRYGINWAGSRFTAYVAIFRKDGTISISHGGVEMGQGINTKVYAIIFFTLIQTLTLTSRENSLELTELSSINKISLV
jgi:xanthine dehydrogenase/oxidase